MSYTSAEQETKHVDPSCTSYDYYSILRTVSEHTEKQGVRKMIEAMITLSSQNKEGDRSHSFSLTHSLQEQGYIIHKEILGQLWYGVEFPVHRLPLCIPKFRPIYIYLPEDGPIYRLTDTSTNHISPSLKAQFSTQFEYICHKIPL